MRRNATAARAFRARRFAPLVASAPSLGIGQEKVEILKKWKQEDAC